MSCVTKCDEGGGEITFSLKCVTSFMDVPYGGRQWGPGIYRSLPFNLGNF